MGIGDLFEHGPSTNASYAIHSQFPVKKSFFKNYSVITLEQVKEFSDSVHAAITTEVRVLKHKDECWYTFLLNSCSLEM